jgi:hypothetical protein
MRVGPGLTSPLPLPSSVQRRTVKRGRSGIVGRSSPCCSLPARLRSTGGKPAIRSTSMSAMAAPCRRRPRAKASICCGPCSGRRGAVVRAAVRRGRSSGLWSSRAHAIGRRSGLAHFPFRSHQPAPPPNHLEDTVQGRLGGGAGWRRGSRASGKCFSCRPDAGGGPGRGRRQARWCGRSGAGTSRRRRRFERRFARAAAGAHR